MKEKTKIKQKESLLKILENAKYFMYYRNNKKEENEEVKYGSKSD